VEGDIVKITNTSLPKGSFVKLQPVSKSFLDVHNPRAVLENSLRHFATLTKGDNIVINYNNKKFEIEIIETKPSDAISIIEADIEVDFAPPKDYVEPERLPLVSPVTNVETSSSSSSLQPSSPAEPAAGSTIFGGSGYRLDGKPVKPSQPEALTRGDHPLLKRLGGGVSGQTEKTIVTASGAIEKTVEINRHIDEPWKNRIPGGVKRDPPYGYLHLMEEKYF
jgi:ubiquitin fusion degradation protein 1